MGNFEMGFENKRIELKFFPSLKSNCSLFISILWIFAALLIIFPFNLLCKYPISTTSAAIVLLNRS